MAGGCWGGKPSGEPLKVRHSLPFYPHFSVLVCHFCSAIKNGLRDTIRTESVSVASANQEVVLLRKPDEEQQARNITLMCLLNTLITGALQCASGLSLLPLLRKKDV